MIIPHLLPAVEPGLEVSEEAEHAEKKKRRLVNKR
jgi:hypothetical protein